MARSLSPEEIAEEVSRALEATLQSDAYPERLWPYTPVQLHFLKEFVSKAITGILERTEIERSDSV